jgi:hypothetical protein
MRQDERREKAFSARFLAPASRRDDSFVIGF